MTIFDARRESPGGFHETGFTLVTLDEEPVTTDWRTEHKRNKDADIKKFHQQMEPYILDLYPSAKKLLWTYNVVRGGKETGDQPRAVGEPHLDFHQDWDLFQSINGPAMHYTFTELKPENQRLHYYLI